MGKRKKGVGCGGEDSGGGGRGKVYLHAVTNDAATLLTDKGNTRPLQEVKKQSRASEVQFHQNQSVTGMKIIIIRATPKQIEKAVSLISQKTGSKETISDQAQKFWLQWVEAAFPDLDSRAYFLPPVYFNRVPMTPGSVSGQDVLILNTKQVQSSKSNQPTPHEGVGGSSEQELTRDAGLGIKPTLPGNEYQDTESSLPGETSQCIQPNSAEEPCISNHRTPPGYFSHVSQLPPDHKAGCSNHVAPPEQADNYIHAASRRQADECIQLTLPGEVSHNNEHNDQFLQTPPGQAGQNIHMDADQYDDTPHGQADQHMHPTPHGEAYQQRQTIQCRLTSQSMQTTSPSYADQDILSPSGLPSHYTQTPPEPTGHYIQTKAYGQAGECIFPIPHEQTSQRTEVEAASSDVCPSVHRPPNVLDSDVRDDAAKQRVLVCVQEFFKQNKEVLVGMSQLTFGHYLGEPVYAAATAQLPRPQNIPKTSSKTTQGSYDVLLIHRHYGFVVCEVRAFGDIASKLSMSKEDINNNIRKKVRDAVSQLDKAEAMLSHLVSDITPGLRITKTIALPNLTAHQVQQAICEDIPLTEDLCVCLETTDPAGITGLCLCSDELSDPKTPCDVSSHVLRELGHWWQRRVAGAGPDSHMTDVVYKMLVARFCGPVTTVSVPCTCPPRVSVKTLGQAVWWTGQCYTAVITLFPEQVELLNKASPRVFVAGPPGTGKTVVLLLISIQWLQCGHHVYVVSTWWGSRAACSMLYHLLMQRVKQLAPEVLESQLHILHVNLNDDENVEKAMNDLSQAASGGPLYVISDEMGHDYTSFKSARKINVFETFCEKLLAQVPRLHLWAASCYHKNCPPSWQVEYLTRPLRSPPSVVREVKKDTVITKGLSIKRYSERGVPDHTDGPPVRRVRHYGQGHSQPWPDMCVTCGREVARILHSLRVGVTENNELTTVNTVTSTTGGTTPCLQWRDVLVLNRRYVSEYMGMFKGLQEVGIPVRAMNYQDIEDVATARSDVVWVADGKLVRGLERKVVVYLQMDERSLEGKKVSRELAYYRSISFHAISRCTSQLVFVE